jgi:cytochrome c biogenesis protein CcdA
MQDHQHDTSQKKSPQERFLFIIGFLFFMIYLVMGIILVFWTTFPIDMEPRYRIALGVVLIVYALFRFMRFYRR